MATPVATAPPLRPGEWHLVELAAGSRVVSIDVDPGAPDVVLAGTSLPDGGAGVFISRDAGRTWQADGLPGAAVQALRFDPEGSGVAFAAAYPGGMLRRDAGPDGEWHALPGEYVDFTDANVSLSVSAGGRFLVVAAYGLSVSHDGGATWDLHRIVPDDDEYEYQCHDVRDAAIAPTDPQIVYASSNSGGPIVSTDHGETWPPAPCGPAPFGTRHGIAVDPTSATTAYVGSSDGVETTVDGGRTWRTLDLDADVRALAIDRLDPSTVYAGTISDVRVSRDGGATWAIVGSDFSAGLVHDLAVDLRDGRTIYAATATGIAIFALP